MTQKYLKHLIRAYDYPKGWEKFYLKFKYRRNSAFDFIEEFVPKQGYIVDVGCGIGILANILAIGSANRRIHGIDLDARRISLAKRTENRRKNLKFDVADVFDVSIEAADVVIICDLLHHLELSTQKKVLIHVYKELKDEGLLVIKEVDRSNKKWIISFLLDSFTEIMNITKGQKLCYRTGNQFMGIVKRIGFRLNEMKVLNGDITPHIMLLCSKRGGSG
ncbi:MAG: class I SAM-dependent methyltransferase [Candidatus Sifarchaeia archaeon]